MSIPPMTARFCSSTMVQRSFFIWLPTTLRQEALPHLILPTHIPVTFLMPADLAKYTVTAEHLYDSLTVYTDKDCMVDTIVKLMNDTWETSCGKCVLCREGTLQFKTITAEMTQGKAKMTDPAMLKEVGEDFYAEK